MPNCGVGAFRQQDGHGHESRIWAAELAMRDESNDWVRCLIAGSFYTIKGVGAFRQQDGHVHGSRIW